MIMEYIKTKDIDDREFIGSKVIGAVAITKSNERALALNDLSITFTEPEWIIQVNRMLIIMITTTITLVLMGTYKMGLVSSETAMVGMLLSAALIVADLIGLYLFKHYDKVSCSDCIYMNTDHPLSNGTCSVNTYIAPLFFYEPFTQTQQICYFENHSGKCTDFKHK